MAVAVGEAQPHQNDDLAAQLAEGLEQAGGGFVREFAKDVTAGEPAPDPEVMAAFALGWQMSELYKPGAWPAHDAEPEADLPGLSGLGGSERAALGLDQIQVGLKKLEAAITAAGLTMPTTAAAVGAIPATVPNAAYEKAIFELHVSLLRKLTATHFKLGKAYGLGRALADTTRLPHDLSTLEAQLEQHRVAKLLDWLSDLTSLFPPHAAHVVHDSLEDWRDWAANGPVDPDGKAVGLLRRQGQRWRSLLSGEKTATDALTVEGYVKAGEVALSRTGSLASGFFKRYRTGIVVAVCLFAAGLGLLIWDPTGGSVAAGLAGIVASLGVTWKGVGASLGNSAAKMERPVWEGALDEEITTSLGLIPGSEPARRYVSPA